MSAVPAASGASAPAGSNVEGAHRQVDFSSGDKIGQVTEFPEPIYSMAKYVSNKTVRLTVGQAVVEFFKNQLSEQLDGNFEPMMHGYWGIFGHGNV